MKVIDRYLIRELIYPIFYCAVSLIVLILIADIFDNLDEFIRNRTPATIIFKYYLSLVPYAYTQTIPWAAWMGTLFLLVHFGFHNELLAMKVAGVKITTIIRPILFTGFLLGIVTFVISDRLLPASMRISDQLSEVYIQKKTPEGAGKTVHHIAYHSPESQLYYFRSLTIAKQEAQGIILLWLDPYTKKTKQKVTAARGAWNGTSWELENVTEHQIDSHGRVLGEPRSYPKKNYPDLISSPKDLINASSDSVYLSYREMKKAMRQLKETGVDVRPERIELQNRLASPWQGILMMFITIPILGPTRTKRGIATAVLVCVGFIFAYHLTGAVGMALGRSGHLLPEIGAWLGNFVFAVLALLYLEKANF
ncbi:MAG: LptF/LptG family permease [Candidatus Omnitrophota bacterium]